MARLPMAQARWSGVRRSRALTVPLTWSVVECANSRMIDFMSVLQGQPLKKRFVKINRVQWMCKSYYLTIASTNCWVSDPRVVLQGVRNSFASYLVRIQCSFSSREAVGDGLVTWLWPERIVDSHTEFERLFPMASITLIWLGLKYHIF